MATTKISELTDHGALAATDVLPIVQDMGGTPGTRKVDLADLQDFMVGTSSSPADAGYFNDLAIEDGTANADVSLKLDNDAQGYEVGVFGSDFDIFKIRNTTTNQDLVQVGPSGTFIVKQHNAGWGCLEIDGVASASGWLLSLQGVESASTTNNLSTYTTPGTISRWAKVKVNSLTLWLPLYTAPSA